jgi:hypothetical protein
MKLSALKILIVFALMSILLGCKEDNSFIGKLEITVSLSIANLENVRIEIYPLPDTQYSIYYNTVNKYNNIFKVDLNAGNYLVRLYYNSTYTEKSCQIQPDKTARLNF